MRAWKFGVVALVLAAGTVTWARAPAEGTIEKGDSTKSLARVGEAIDAKLREADAAVARAAKDLGKTGITGPKAHARLDALCRELTYAVTCTAADAEGVLVTVTPAEFSGFEGSDVGGQEHMAKPAREPLLSGVFRSVEGFDAINLRHPVVGKGGKVLGTMGVLIRPASLVGHAVKPIVGAGGPEVFVMQRDGTMLYDPDAAEIGRNLFEDPMYTAFPELQELGKRIAADREGEGSYRFLGRGLAETVTKRVRWTTVGLHGTEWRAAVVESAEGGAPPVARYEEPKLPVRAEIGLSALVALSDEHLTDIAEDLRLIATTDAVRSGEWKRVEAPLRHASEANVESVWWYAKPDGRYWTLGKGDVTASLADRPYFARALDGDTVLGDLVVSKSTGEDVAIVAVPVKGEGGDVTGVLGASVHLDEMSAQLRKELGLGEGEHFYAFDEGERVALHPQSDKVFLRAGELGPEIEQAFREMKERKEGTVRYTYEDRPRTLVYKRSDVTGWWYAFGVLGEREREG